MESLAADYFDGRSARALRVTRRLDGGRLLIDGAGLALAVPLHEVRWPERTRHGPRVAHLSDGASVQCADGPAWDDWRGAAGLHDPAVVRLQQSWHGTL